MYANDSIKAVEKMTVFYSDEFKIRSSLNQTGNGMIGG
jgi:hypothetical protein